MHNTTTSINTTSASSLSGPSAESLEFENNMCTTSSDPSEVSFTISLHFIGVVLVLLISAFGLFSMLFLATRKSNLIVAKVLLLAKMFGIGVIAGTAWLHLLPEAFEAFDSHCIPAFWQGFGKNWVGIFALASSFLVQQIEMAGHSHVSNLDVDSSSNPHGTEELQLGQDAMKIPDSVIHSHLHHDHPIDIEEDQDGLMHRISTIILESGILAHSLIIGLTLGVCPDSTFTTLLIAVCFHQFFEGMALGVLVAQTTLSTSMKIKMGLLYPLTTPVGITTGIFLHSHFESNASMLVLTQAIFGSLSAGILIYNTYVELFAGEITGKSSFRRQSRGMKIVCFVFVYLGAAAMSVLAIWA